jgi:hypothetical protein
VARHPPAGCGAIAFSEKSRHDARAKCGGKVAQNRANEIALRKTWLSVLGHLL